MKRIALILLIALIGLIGFSQEKIKLEKPEGAVPAVPGVADFRIGMIQLDWYEKNIVVTLNEIDSATSAFIYRGKKKVVQISGEDAKELLNGINSCGPQSLHKRLFKMLEEKKHISKGSVVGSPTEFYDLPILGEPEPPWVRHGRFNRPPGVTSTTLP